MQKGLKAFFVHFFVTVFFILAALAYFHPVLQGKVIQQSDIVQYTGMAKEQNDYRKRIEINIESFLNNFVLRHITILKD